MKEEKIKREPKSRAGTKRKGTGLDYLLFNSVVCALTGDARKERRE